MTCLEYNSHWLDNLPPSSITDWIQVIISTLAAVAIFIALLPQMRTARLEELAFRRTNIPLFEFSLGSDSPTLNMKISDNHVKGYKIVITHNGPHLSIPGLEIFNPVGLLKDQVVKWEIAPFDIPANSLKNMKDTSLELSVIYSDLYGYTYVQVSNLFMNGDAVRFVPTYLGRKIDIPLYVSKRTKDTI